MIKPQSMLESTFIHVPGVGSSTERRLWESGANDWAAYLAGCEENWPVSTAQRTNLKPIIEESVLRLQEANAFWFAKRIPSSEHWRAAQAFGSQMAYLDIETDGGQSGDSITLIGLYDGHTMHQFIRGKNLQEFPDALNGIGLLITFYGTGFDLPMLQRAFAGLSLQQMHIDLCYLMRRLGYRGGLKQIERRLGIIRSNSTDGLSGMDAVRLWHEYQLGRRTSLRTLLEYNAEDTRNMADILEEGYKRMTKFTLGQE